MHCLYFLGRFTSYKESLYLKTESFCDPPPPPNFTFATYMNRAGLFTHNVEKSVICKLFLFSVNHIVPYCCRKHLIRDRSLFMAGVGAEEKVGKNHYPTFFETTFPATPPVECWKTFLPHPNLFCCNVKRPDIKYVI